MRNPFRNWDTFEWCLFGSVAGLLLTGLFYIFANITDGRTEMQKCQADCGPEARAALLPSRYGRMCSCLPPGVVILPGVSP